MEKARVQLIKKGNFYYVLTYENSEYPKYKTVFPYNSEDQQKQLENAGEFGQNMAKSHNTTLEENLDNNA